MSSDGISRKGFGPLESEVMDSVWSAGGSVAVRKVVDDLNERRTEPLAYTTVMTVMSRLADKEVLSRRKAGRGYVYEANAPDAAGIAVKDVLRAHGAAARADPVVLRRLRRLLSESDG